MDIDWDDEDEKTTVFDRAGEDTARALLHPSGPPLPAAGTKPPPPPPKPAAGAAPPPPAPPALSRPSMPVPAPPRGSGPPPPPPVAAAAAPTLITMRPPASRLPVPTPAPMRTATSPGRAMTPATAMTSTPSDPFARTQSGKVKWAAVAAAALLIVIAFVFVMMPGTGTLVVSVAGPGNKSVDKVKVFIDDQEVCSQSPCIAADLKSGTHIVKVVAEGYGSTAGKAYSVESGTETPVNITLAAPSPGTGILVKHDGSGLKLWVDGKEIGPLPQELKEMSPGSHQLKIGGSDRYEEHKETINVEIDKMLTVEPKLKVIKGEATLEPGENAEGAKILLVSGKERRPLNKDLPVRLEVGTDKRYKIVATKEGYETYENFIEFDDGKAEKTFIISLKESGDGAVAADDGEADAPARSAPPVSAAARFTGAPTHTPPAAAAAAGKGVLNINSIPVSKVILDGVPKGTTPVIGVKVAPGTHTVVFQHPEHGRKVRAVTVQAGKTATAAVRFP